MITAIRRQCIVFAITLLSFLTYSHAQDLRTFNQNSSRSNNTRVFNQNSARSNLARGLSISLSPVYSTATNTNSDSLLFRGSGAGFRFGADYFFGKAGISFSSGFGSSSPTDATINNFLKKFPIPPDQLTVTKGKQQNMYLLLGPSVRFGKTVELYAHAKGGLFINNSGLVSIQQKGAQRAAYRNESGSKSAYPGFLTGLGVQYSTKSDVWSFGIGVDYMNTKSEVNNYDVRRGGGIEALKLSRNITDIVTGITVRYNIVSPRDHASGQSTGKREPGKPKYDDIKAARDAASGLSTGKRVLPTVNKREIAIDEPGVQKTLESCGPVTQKITNPDGTTEEMTFSCPDDAANYASQMKMDGGMPNRISMNVTVPKQTQGATFGEKVNQGLHASGGALAQGAALSIISGTLTWGSANTGGIITNKAIYNGNTTRGGSVTMNSQTSSTRQTNQSSFGTMVRLSARDHASGQATGKRSRERGSGLATGRRQYEPIFAEGQEDVCNPCLATAKMSGAKSNPLYNDKSVSGENPFYEANKRTVGGEDEDEDCDGVAAADIFLIDAGSGSVVAKTKTEECGDFFFANVPEGNYVVKVSGSFIGKKGYDVYLKSKTDLAGGVTATDDWDVQLLINASNGNDEMTQKAGISTSRSNIRSKSLTIIEADLDGDGEYESLKATGTFSDGSTRDITSAARKTISNASGIKGIVLDGNAFQMTRRRVEVLKSNKQGDPNANRLTSILVTTGSRLTAIGTFSDGSTRDITEGLVSNTDHLGVKQYSITVGDSDDDGIADAVIKTKTKSNQSNDRMANEDADDDNDNGLMNAKGKITKSRSNIQNNRMINNADGDTNADNVLLNARAKIGKSRSNIQNNRTGNDEESDDIWSPRSNIKMLRVATGDVDGDGKAESIVGGLVPGGAVISASKRPGEPIPGIDIKLGKNPGGQSLQSTTSNENGEFEFTKLEAGDYTILIEQKIFIEDETLVILGGNNTKTQDYNSSRSNKSGIVDNDPDNGDDVARKGWDGTIKGGSKTKAQDHNSSRSNKSGIVDNDPDNGDDAARKGWDGTIKGGSKTKAQDHNSSRSNKSGIVDNDPDNGGDINNTGPKKWMAPELFKRTVNTSRSNIKNVLASLDDLEEQLGADATNERYLVNTSRSNIKNQRLAAYDLSEKLADMEFMEKEAAMNEVNKKMAAMNMQFLALQKSLSEMGRQYTTVSNVLKTKHDIAMNSIRNLK